MCANFQGLISKTRRGHWMLNNFGAVSFNQPVRCRRYTWMPCMPHLRSGRCMVVAVKLFCPNGRMPPCSHRIIGKKRWCAKAGARGGGGVPGHRGVHQKPGILHQPGHQTGGRRWSHICRNSAEGCSNPQQGTCYYCCELPQNSDDVAAVFHTLLPLLLRLLHPLVRIHCSVCRVDCDNSGSVVETIRISLVCKLLAFL